MHDAHMMDRPGISLIVATAGRATELRPLLQSLVEQNYRDFEILIVDQNSDARVDNVLRPFLNFLRIRHIRAETGLSRARNCGLAVANGDWVAFPDDDCWYKPDTLSEIIRLTKAHPEWNGLIGQYLAPDDTPVFTGSINQRFAITRDNVWDYAPSITIFLQRSLACDIGGFNSRLGIGAGPDWAASEETDFLLNALKRNAWIVYSPEVRVCHPRPFAEITLGACAKQYRYGLGAGAVMRRHAYPIRALGRHLLPAMRVVLKLLCRGQFLAARLHAARVVGMVRGWYQMPHWYAVE
jgi:glycosyltransferase involved in cell wall biosynthesis